MIVLFFFMGWSHVRGRWLDKGTGGMDICPDVCPDLGRPLIFGVLELASLYDGRLHFIVLYFILCSIYDSPILRSSDPITNPHMPDHLAFIAMVTESLPPIFSRYPVEAKNTRGTRTLRSCTLDRY